MAKLIMAGEFATANEQMAAETLKTLPSSWRIICNKVLPRDNGYTSYELDFIIVADQWIFLLDEKSWRGHIRGNDQVWVFANGSSTASPLSKSDYTAKVLAGYIRRKVPQFANEYFVHGGVLLSAAQSKPVLTGEPRASTGIFLLTDVCRQLQKLDQDGGTPLVGKERDKIVDALTGLSVIPEVPKQINTYEVEELLFTRQGVRAFLAKQMLNADGQSRTLMVYDLGTDHTEAQKFYIREFESLKRLERTGLVPRFSDPFLWSDNFLVFPIEPLEGKSLAAYPVPEKADEIALEINLAAAAFRGLEAMHAEGVIHRALGPDNVYVYMVGEKTKIGFNNFYAARIGTQSIAGPLDKLGIEDLYAAPELAMGYGRATTYSDTYSLTLIFLERLTGVRVSDLRANPRETVEVPKLQSRWTILPDAVARDLTDLFESIVGESNPERRWTAGEAAKLLSDISQSLRAARTSPESTTQSGQLLDGRYEVQRILGRGASAVTYLAKDNLSDDLVAIKHFNNPQVAVQEIRAEWEALKNIKSDRLPRIYDIFEPEKDAHVKIEYIPGPTLQEVEGRELPWDEAHCHSFALDLLEALHHLESLHLLHRDLKPANIILRESDGRPVLIDCGFAVIAGTKSSPAGSQRFMPPEAFNASDPPPSCDLYALAVVLYRVLTGLYPDTCDDATALSALWSAGRTSEEIARISQVLKALRRTLSTDPSERPASAMAMQTTLMQAFQSIPGQSSTPLELTPQVNPWVDEIRGLYRHNSSGNANNRGLDTAFVRDTYIPTALDELLLPAIRLKRPKAVFLSGNPGDGKTAFLARVRENLVRDGAAPTMDDASGWEVVLDGHIFRCCYDASESHAGASADDQLARKLQGLEGGMPSNVALTVLVAINDGRLADFFERYKAPYTWLEQQVRKPKRPHPPAEPSVWVVDLKRRAFVSDGKGTQLSLARQVLANLVHAERWQVCDTCKALAMCPIRANATALRQSATAERLEHLILLTHLRRRHHITMRDLRSSLAYLITGNANCTEIHDLSEGRSPDRSPRDLSYWRTVFVAADGSADLTTDLANLDPANEANPTLDRFLFFHRQPADTALRRELFRDGVDLAPQTYSSVTQWIADVKRRLYFERTPEATALIENATNAELLPYRYVDQFLAALRGEVDNWELSQRIARGILRSDGVNIQLGPEKLGLKVSASEEEEITILKEFPLKDFALQPEERTPQHAVEEIREVLRFRRIGRPVTLLITLDLFELLMRLADGLQPDAPELRPLLEDLVPFKNALLREETRDLTIIEGLNRTHQITQREGKIVRISRKG